MPRSHRKLEESRETPWSLWRERPPLTQALSLPEGQRGTCCCLKPRVCDDLLEQPQDMAADRQEMLGAASPEAF